MAKMKPGNAAGRPAKVGVAKRAGVAKAALPKAGCGSGAGGFKPGNTCGRKASTSGSASHATAPVHGVQRIVKEARRGVAAASTGPIEPGSIADRIKQYQAGETARVAAVALHDRYEAKARQLGDEIRGHNAAINTLASEINDRKRLVDRSPDASPFKAEHQAALTAKLRDLEAKAAERARLQSRKDGLVTERNRAIHSVSATGQGIKIDHGFASGVYRGLHGLNRGLRDKSLRAIEQGNEFVAKQFRAIEGNGDKLIVRYLSDADRAYQDGKIINSTRESYISLHPDNETAGTVVHELGHALDWHDRRINHRSLEFLKHRVGDEKPQPMKDLIPGGRYTEKEFGRRDDFERAFGAQGPYVGKDYGGEHSEILSMGLQKFHDDPGQFAKADPEYFKFIHGILSGALR